MRFAFFALLLAAGCAEQADAPVQPQAPDRQLAPPRVDIPAETRTISSELDDWHAAAASADEKRYFDHFTEQAVFLGTDATERWDLDAFKKAVHPYFAKGKAWKYRSVRRAITVSPEGKRAWFDEDLETERLGPARGSGVLVKDQGRWRIAQYDLSIPIPNARFAEVHALLSGAPKLELREQYKAAYAAATAAAKDDPAKAAKLLSDLVPEAKTHPEDDLEFWLHNELTWIRWAQDDLAGALREVEAARATLDHSTLAEDKRVGLRLHELWDRAYILLELAMKEPPKERAKAMAGAQAAKDAYDMLAKSQKDENGMAVLATFFAVRQGKNADALAAAKKVDIEKDSDVQDLYVLRIAKDAGGDKPGAEAIVKKMCGSKDYLMRPLILRQSTKEGWRCP
jgi:hypothetical protein